jgi:glycosyltransferase involved in cell wall biosynthesis
MSVDITVAICTYNGADRLPTVLEKLRSQFCSTEIDWEVIVVDNNSNDLTAEVVKSFQKNWLKNVPLKYSFEPQQGLGFARQHAIEMAQGNRIGFLDDDNLPSENWVEQAFKFGLQHPNAGVYGGYIQACYESEPPPNFDRISRFLAIGGAQQDICYSSPDYPAYQKHVYPPGAGVVVVREAWLSHVPKQLQLQGRVSGCQLPGDDVEAFTYIRRAGWEIWHNPSMLIEHQIPNSRLQKLYIQQLMWNTGLSRHHTRHLAHQHRYWLMLMLYLANDLRKLLYHFLVHPIASKDIVINGERQLLLGSFISPFYFLSLQLTELFKSMSPVK